MPRSPMHRKGSLWVADTLKKIQTTTSNVILAAPGQRSLSTSTRAVRTWNLLLLFLFYGFTHLFLTSRAVPLFFSRSRSLPGQAAGADDLRHYHVIASGSGAPVSPPRVAGPTAAAN